MKSIFELDATTGLNTHTYDYAYDSVDNRTFSSENGAVTFTYDLASRLLTSTSESYTFDDNGNCVSVWESADSWVSMVYDKENRMVEHHQYDANQDPSLVISTYTYNADSQKRKEESLGEGVATLIWDGSEYLGEES